MKRNLLENALMTYFNSSWTQTLKAFPNHEFTPTQDAWTRLTFKYADAIFGDTDTDVEKGFLFIDIFVPKGTGTNQAMIYAEQIRTLFRNQTIDGIKCSEVSIKPLGVVDGDYQVQCVINFINFIQ